MGSPIWQDNAPIVLPALRSSQASWRPLRENHSKDIVYKQVQHPGAVNRSRPRSHATRTAFPLQHLMNYGCSVLGALAIAGLSEVVSNLVFLWLLCGLVTWSSRLFFFFFGLQKNSGTIPKARSWKLGGLPRHCLNHRLHTERCNLLSYPIPLLRTHVALAQGSFWAHTVQICPAYTFTHDTIGNINNQAYTQVT